MRDCLPSSRRPWISALRPHSIRRHSLAFAASPHAHRIDANQKVSVVSRLYFRAVKEVPW